MAKDRWCVRCEGAGIVTCTICTGYGYWYPGALGSDPDGPSTMCTVCSGAGEVPCPVCRGSGRVEV
jgi:DnaJ-class molecular chaperone